jgi:hypothetical protein
MSSFQLSQDQLGILHQFSYLLIQFLGFRVLSPGNPAEASLPTAATRVNNEPAYIKSICDDLHCYIILTLLTQPSPFDQLFSIQHLRARYQNPCRQRLFGTKDITITLRYLSHRQAEIRDFCRYRQFPSRNTHSHNITLQAFSPKSKPELNDNLHPSRFPSSTYHGREKSLDDKVNL